jgi:sodium pump decarboxylase gamma subunit
MNDLILGIQLTILGMGMVLIILAILYVAVSALGWIVNRERGESLFVPESHPEAAVTTPETREAPEAQTVVRDERERVAAISAAVSAYKQVRRTRSHRSPYMVPYS